MTIPLSSSMTAILARYMRTRGGKPEDYLFCEDTGEQLTEIALRRSIERYNRSRGVKKTGLHKFRHTFARMYITEIGGNAFKLQKLLGHSTLAMTRHYAAIYDQDLLGGYDDESPLELFHPKKIRMK